MSILIKGMEMPRKGNWKIIRIYSDGTCVTSDSTILKGARAFEIPPHGRLIDADALAEEMCDVTESIGGWNYRFGYSRDKIKNTPTVIEADCPLDEPLPHGRLIDADALKAKMPTIGDEYLYARDLIDEAPTIIGAEAKRK